MTQSESDHEDRSREIAGLFYLSKQLLAALKKLAPEHPLCQQRERYVVYLEGYSGLTGIEFHVAMKFKGDLRTGFFKATI